MSIAMPRKSRIPALLWLPRAGCKGGVQVRYSGGLQGWGTGAILGRAVRAGC